jgi:exopolysaccharide biosynthesis polyprenyl glycosylphosphotransferase
LASVVSPEVTIPRPGGPGQRPLLRPPVAPDVSVRRWLTVLARRLVLLDIFLVSAAVAGALLVRFGQSATTEAVMGLEPYPVSWSYLVMSVILGAGWALSLGISRVYDRKVLGIGVEEYKRLANSSLRYWGLVAIVCFLAHIELARGFLAVAFPVGTAALLFGRWIARKLLHRARARSGGWSHRVLVVGAPDEVRDLVVQLRRSPYAGLEVVGACVTGGERIRMRHGEHVPTVGTLTSVPQAVAATGADTVAVTSSRGISSNVLKRLGWELEGAGVDLVVAPGLMDVAGPRVHVRPVAGLPLLHVEQPEFTGPIRAVKAAFDRLVALVGLVALAPLMLAIAVAIKLTSPGPVVFRQIRVASQGELFTLYKFRSMVDDAELRLHAVADGNDCDGVMFKMRRDPRITLVGRWLRRFSLDELPQLINVLRGQMSLVGPRPALPSEAEQYGDDVARRLLVKPGITGLWQVSGRSDLSWEDSVRLDLYYVENWSFAGDIQILWKTLSAVLSSRGAY